MTQGAQLEGDAPPDIPPWRYRAGLCLFVLGNVMLFSSPIVVPALGFSPAFIGVAVVAAEVLTFSSVFFLGWSGLKQLKSKLFGFFKYDPSARPVGRTRHRIGLFLTFFVSLALDLLGIGLVFLAYEKATPAYPMPMIWGLSHQELGWLVASLFIGSYISLIVGLAVLGDHWWGRFRELFVWQGGRSEQ
jgi:hypothetical protein